MSGLEEPIGGVEPKDAKSLPEYVAIASYRGVKLLYGTWDGQIHFEFEGPRKTHYIFEAKAIIDEPRWEPYKAKGYWKDNMLEPYIGLAKAERRDTKSGVAEWQYKGKYDMKYKVGDSWREGPKVYPKNAHNDQVYERFQEQQKAVWYENAKLKDIVNDLASNNPEASVELSNPPKESL